MTTLDSLADKMLLEMVEKKKEVFYKSFQHHFQDRAALHALLEKLREEDQVNAIKLGFFYNIMTTNISNPGVTLICVFSIMEATAPEKFQSFDHWLLGEIKRNEEITFHIDNKRSFKKTISEFQRKYYETHGASMKVRNFIKRYFSLSDKKDLINGFMIKDTNIRTSFDALTLNEKIKAIVDMLYRERSIFVHEAQLPQLSDNNKILASLRIKKTEKFVSVTISINKIQEMFEKAFLRYLRSKCI